MFKEKINCLLISELKEIEQRNYFEKFGQEGWLDVEQKVLINVGEMNEYSIAKLNTFFGIDATDYSFIVVILG